MHKIILGDAMYINSAYLNDSLLNYKDMSNPISIVSCGNYRLKTIDKMPTKRPKGRLDYQLIYIASGTAHFYFEKNGEETVIPAGSFVLYRPKEYQNYIYYGSDHAEVFWLHFTGSEVKNILHQYNIDDSSRVFRTGPQVIYSDIFMNIINEIQQKKTGYELLIEAFLRQLFVLISRSNENTSVESNIFIQNEVHLAREYFNENYSKEININRYASSRGMSVSWFIRCFKDITGITPLQYILSQRISNAQLLLESTDYSISEISNLVGYDNPLYFSRLFCKQRGMSPRNYRDMIRN